MSYLFSDLGDLSCAEIVRQHRSLLMGNVAVNTSFDSGRLSRLDWKRVNGYCLTPPITPALLEEWPISHDDCWDEWWVFDNQVPQDFEVTAFCNYNFTISRYKELDFEGGCRLDHYLARFRPAGVFGNNQLCAYLIRADAKPGAI
jgi:hypothetical protein